MATSIFIVGVAGGSGSGKSTVVSEASSRLRSASLDVAILEHDAYYRDLSHLPKSQRRIQNFDHPRALETPLLVEHLDRLKEGEAVTVPIYDYSDHIRYETGTRLSPAGILFVVGIHVLFDEELRSRLDMKVFVHADADVRLARRIERDLETRGRTIRQILKQYRRSVRPMHIRYVEPSKEYADLLLSNERDVIEAAENLVVAIQDHL